MNNELQDYWCSKCPHFTEEIEQTKLDMGTGGYCSADEVVVHRLVIPVHIAEDKGISPFCPLEKEDG